jgi:hypothetical protein
MKLISEKTQINTSNEKIFHLVSNCSNFGKYLPPDVSNFEATEEYFKFDMKNIAKFQIDITEKTPFSKVVFKASNDKNIPIGLEINIIEQQGFSLAQIELQAEIPFILQSMVKSPLQKFIDILIAKIKLESEKV